MERLIYVLNCQSRGFSDGGEPFQIFKGENVLVKLLLIMEILVQADELRLSGIYARCHRIISFRSRSSRSRHEG